MSGDEGGERDNEGATDEQRQLAAARDVVAVFDANANAGGVEVDAVDEQRFRVTWPNVSHAIMQVKAALLLIGAEMPFAAQANARSAFEHAMVAQWVTLTEGGDQAAADEVRRQLRAKTLDISTFIELPEQLLPGDPITSPRGGPARRFESLCDRFSPPASAASQGKQAKVLYTLYRSLGGSVHPSTETWAQYFEWDESGSTGLRAAGRPELGMDLAPALAISGFLAVGALEGLRRGQPNLPKLRAMANRYGLPVDLRGDDQHPELQPQKI